MRPDESINHNLPISIQSGESSRPVGLLLEEDEAIDVLTQFASTTIQPPISLSADLKKELLFDGIAFDPEKPEEYAHGFSVNNIIS